MFGRNPRVRLQGTRVSGLRPTSPSTVVYTSVFHGPVHGSVFGVRPRYSTRVRAPSVVGSWSLLLPLLWSGVRRSNQPQLNLRWKHPSREKGWYGDTEVERAGKWDGSF